MWWRNKVRWRFHPLYTLLILPLILLMAYGNQFLYLSGAKFSDLTISHLPNALFLRRAILEWGQIPLWAPGILSGFPFVADPLSGLFYPPGWLVVLWPEPWMFNILAGAHLAWGGIGMALLLQKAGLGHVSTIFGALAFAFMPKLIAHYGAGHVTLVYAVGWTPWLLYVSYLALAVDRKSRKRYGVFDIGVWPALILAIIFFADVRWAAFAGLLWAGWWFLAPKKHAYNRISLRDDSRDINYGEVEKVDEPTQPISHFQSLISSFAVQLLLAALLVAPLAFPLLEFIRLSTRATLTTGDVLAFSLPPTRLLGFLFPELGGMQEWVVYSGMLTLTLALIGGVLSEVRQRTRFWWGVWLVAVLFSLGENIPGMSVLANLPGVSLLRVPSRAMFLAGMAMAILAAFALDRLVKGVGAEERRWAMRVLIGLFGVAATMAVGVWSLIGDLPLNFIWGAGMAGVSLLGVGWMLRARRPLSSWAGFLLIGISILDWGGVNVRSLTPYSVQEIYSENADVAGFLSAKSLAEQKGMFRVYSPSYSLPQHIAAKYGLELADGVDPMQLASYTVFMALASGVPQAGYSVTVPPFAGEVSMANAAYVPDVGLLGSLNVKYVAAEFDMVVEGLRLVRQFGETRVYENERFLPRAWVNNSRAGVLEEIVPATVLEWTPNRIRIQAEGEGLLVVSEQAYPGWGVEVDGRRADIQTLNGVLRGVVLPSGTHDIVFIFRPTSLFLGLGLFGLVIIFLIATNLRKQDRP